jgi:hypothetical protein
VAAAIRGGFVNTLIVDSSLARAMLTHESQKRTEARARGLARAGAACANSSA